MIEAGASVLRRMLGVYGSSKMGVLLLLGFSSGLPLLLINTTLNAWLTQAGLTTIAIGLFNLLNLPYSFKFLWSPVLDRFLLPAPGSLRGSRRRGWMALTQVLLLLSIGLLGFQDPTQTWLEALGWEELAQTWPGITVFTRPIFLVGLLVAFFERLSGHRGGCLPYRYLGRAGDGGRGSDFCIRLPHRAVGQQWRELDLGGLFALVAGVRDHGAADVDRVDYLVFGP